MNACYLALFVMTAMQVASAVPKIKIDKVGWNFGVITNHGDITHDFEISNIGDSVLEIRDIVSGCNSCLRASLEKAKIPPGEVAYLHAQLDLRLIQGAVFRNISFNCNDPLNPSNMLGITGFVVPAYRVVPNEIVMDLSQGSKNTVAQVLSLRSLNAPLSEVVCDNTNFIATISTKSSNCFMVNLRVLETFPNGRAQVNLTVRSADSNDSPCEIKAFINNPPDFEVIPARLNFQAKTGKQMRILWVKQRGIHPLVLVDVIPPSKEIHCEIERVPASYDYKIYVTAWQQEERKGETNLLNLKVLDQVQQERLIPISISVAQVEPESVTQK